MESFTAATRFVTCRASRTTHFKTISHNSLLLLQFLHEQHTSRLSFTTLFYCFGFFTNNTLQDYQLQLSFIVLVSLRTAHFKIISPNTPLLLQICYFIIRLNWALDLHHQTKYNYCVQRALRIWGRVL